MLSIIKTQNNKSDNHCILLKEDLIHVLQENINYIPNEDELYDFTININKNVYRYNNLYDCWSYKCKDDKYNDEIDKFNKVISKINCEYNVNYFLYNDMFPINEQYDRDELYKALNKETLMKILYLEYINNTFDSKIDNYKYVIKLYKLVHKEVNYTKYQDYYKEISIEKAYYKFINDFNTNIIEKADKNNEKQLNKIYNYLLGLLDYVIEKMIKKQMFKYIDYKLIVTYTNNSTINKTYEILEKYYDKAFSHYTGNKFLKFYDEIASDHELIKNDQFNDLRGCNMFSIVLDKSNNDKSTNDKSTNETQDNEQLINRDYILKYFKVYYDYVREYIENNKYYIQYYLGKDYISSYKELGYNKKFSLNDKNEKFNINLYKYNITSLKNLYISNDYLNSIEMNNKTIQNITNMDSMCCETNINTFIISKEYNDLLKNVKTMNKMFYYCDKLKRVYLNNDLDNLEECYNMFYLCNELEEIYITEKGYNKLKSLNAFNYYDKDKFTITFNKEQNVVKIHRVTNKDFHYERDIRLYNDEDNSKPVYITEDNMIQFPIKNLANIQINKDNINININEQKQNKNNNKKTNKNNNNKPNDKSSCLNLGNLFGYGYGDEYDDETDDETDDEYDDEYDEDI